MNILNRESVRFRTLTVLLALAMLLGLTACQTGTKTEAGKVTTATVTTLAPTQAKTEVAVTTTAAATTIATTKAAASTVKATAITAEIKVAALKGPTAMGFVHLMDASGYPDQQKNVKFTLENQPEAIGPKLFKGEYDLAAVPANLAAVLQQKSQGKLQVLAINTLGVLYLAENGTSVKGTADLKGKTIFTSGKGSTPEIVLLEVLDKAGLKVGTDVNVEFLSDHTEVLSRLAATEGAVGLLPQPFLTAASVKNPKIRQALDLNELWEKQNGGSQLITGVLVGRRDFVEKQKETVNAFLGEYKNSVAKSQNEIEATAKLIGKYEIVPEPVAKKALPFCHIVFVDGKEMQKTLTSFYTVLHKHNPQSVGGALPGEDFYYQP